MSNRLNQDREKKLAPDRMNRAIAELESRGFTVSNDDSCIYFEFERSKVKYFPYSGWATGKSIKDGRGLKPLLRQLDDIS